MKIKFIGVLGEENISFELDGMGRLILTHSDGTEEPYNEEHYDEDQYSTIRSMLIRDGVRDLRDVD